LVKLIINQKISIIGLNNLCVACDDFHNFNVETLQAVPLLYQTGYLTISDYDEDLNQFVLGYPNVEVSSLFAKSLLEQYVQPSSKILDKECNIPV
jgi:hypothetical protein